MDPPITKPNRYNKDKVVCTSRRLHVTPMSELPMYLAHILPTTPIIEAHDHDGSTYVEGRLTRKGATIYRHWRRKSSLHIPTKYSVTGFVYKYSSAKAAIPGSLSVSSVKFLRKYYSIMLTQPLGWFNEPKARFPGSTAPEKAAVAALDCMSIPPSL